MNIKTINQLETTQSVEGMYGVACDATNEAKKYKLPSLMAGEGNNSVILTVDNNVISENCVSFGKNNSVGLRGFYYKHIRFVSSTLANIYLSKTQVIPTITTGGEIKDTTIIPSDYLSKGDTISIVNDNKYNDIAEINNISEGMIQIKWLSEAPFATIKKETNLSPEDYSIYCLDKPTQGISDLGKYSFANGTDNKAINTYTEVSGKGNIAKGKFAKVWGKDNVGGYNTTTFGTKNTNLADNSFVNGTNNINEGNNSVIHGNKNKNYGKRAFVVGNENITNNENEAAFGKYNDSENDTLFSIGIGTSDTDRKNAFEVKQNGDIYIEGVEGRIQDKLDKLVNITYSELKSLRDSSQLIPGQQYRITDYTTTTVQENTQSARHPFDIIVTADDVNALNENARAIRHEGDIYFVSSDLNAWKLKYCLDNDISRFAWADATNGKGVIYRMIDEFDNDCPYDFKNILFLRNNGWYYTFAQGGTDKSLRKNKRCWLNVIKSWFDSSLRKYALNNNVFIDTNDADDVPCIGNILEHNCFNNTFGANIVWNTIGAYSDNNTFGNAIKHNTTLSRFSNNKLGDEIHHNTFGTHVKNNTLGSNIEECQFGNGCISNLLASNSKHIRFGNGIYNVKLSGPNAENVLQNFVVTDGLSFSSPTNIVVERSRAFQTTIAIDSAGNVKQFCIADIIQ